MSKIEEARKALEAVLKNLVGSQAEVMKAADAYGDTRELKGHVDACSEVKIRETPMTAGKGGMSVVEEICGVAGWLCNAGREIEELGR